MIVSFTRGEAGRIRDADIARRSTIASVRESELAQACRRLGVTNTRCLDFADGSLESTDRAELVDAAVDLILEFEPDTIISFDETGAYGHPDHITVSEVSVQAAKAAADPARAGMGRTHAVDRVLHACFPQSDRLLLDLLVDWLTTLPERFKGTDTFVNALLMFADSSSMLGFAADHLRIEWFPRNAYVVEQGAVADSLYLLLSGAVEVYHEHNGALTRIGLVEPGGFIGEVGLATGQRRGAHCITTEDSACFVFTADSDTDWKPRGPGPDEQVGSPDHRSVDVRDRHQAGLDGAIVHDVEDLVTQKVHALSAHRSQYTIAPGLFPESMLNTVLGTEYFYEVLRSPDAAPLELPYEAL